MSERRRDASDAATTIVNPCKADMERRQAAFEDRSISEVRGEFTRRIDFEVGYDHRAFPGACGGGGHGQHGMTVRFILIGAAGATQFVFFLMDLVPGRVELGRVRSSGLGSAMAVDVGYHWPTPRYEGQSDYECEILPGGRCYYDGSGLAADPVLEGFIENGPAAVWKERRVRQLSRRFGCPTLDCGASSDAKEKYMPDGRRWTVVLNESPLVYKDQADLELELREWFRWSHLEENLDIEEVRPT